MSVQMTVGSDLRTGLVLVAAALLATGCGGGTEAERDIPDAIPSGENVMDVGTHEIHVNALTTDMVPPEVAQAYGISRSKQRALLNVAIVDKSTSQSIESKVEVAAVNLTGQRKNITMRKVDEAATGETPAAVYYIGEVPVANRETLLFDVAVTVPGGTAPVSLKFKRQFFSD